MPATWTVSVPGAVTAVGTAAVAAAVATPAAVTAAAVVVDVIGAGVASLFSPDVVACCPLRFNDFSDPSAVMTAPSVRLSGEPSGMSGNHRASHASPSAPYERKTP